MPRLRARLRRLAPDAVGTLLAVLLLLSARSSLADHYHVPSGSMQPTVAIGDHLVVDKRAYGLRLPFTDDTLLEGPEPEPGDVVVLASPEDGVTLLKRLVAGPGQTVEVRGGRLWLDGAEQPMHADAGGLEEDLGGHHHPVSLASGGGPDLGPVVVPADRYLVMGDNRGNSYDGRMFGFVPRSALRGRALGITWSGGRPTWRGL
jgi:signal peptidase I